MTVALNWLRVTAEPIPPMTAMRRMASPATANAVGTARLLDVVDWLAAPG